MDRALFEIFPAARGRIPWIELGDFPTPVDSITVGGTELLIKRDDLSSSRYGGNKVRTLEILFGTARRAGARRIYSTGAFGSNHALATVLHAPTAELEAGVILFPQPRSKTALENLRATLARRPITRCLPHWSFLPLGMSLTARSDRRAGIAAVQMVPGGATPEGALGYVSAALELARQVEDGELPRPSRVVIGVGSTCTSAGLLVGMRVAADLGLGWSRPPELVSVRVTPWPVTSAYRIVDLAARTAALFAERVGEERFAYHRRLLASGLDVDGRHLGAGYGKPTTEGIEAIRIIRETASFELDTTYSAKAMAGALARARVAGGVTLFWSTKSTATLPETTESDWRWAPRRMTRWIERAERELIR